MRQITVKIYDYPEAAGKIDMYEGIINNLKKNSAEIQKFIDLANSSIRKNTLGSFSTGYSIGEYVDAYNTARTNWFSDLTSIKSSYACIHNEITSCISQAQKLKSEWEYKKTIYHEETIIL